MHRQTTSFTINGIWKIFFAGFLYTLCVACAGESVNQQDNVLLAQKKFSEAIRFASLNSRGEMYNALMEAIRLDPLEPRYHWEIGRSYFADSELEKAEREFKHTIRLNDGFWEAHKELGRLYMRMGDLEKAVFYLKESLRKPGVSSPQAIHNWIAISYYGQNKFQEAESAWLEALRIKENESVLLNLALAYRDREFFDKAIDTLKRAVRANARFAPAHFHLALLYLKNKDFELATKYFDQTVELDPTGEQGKSSLEYLKMIKAKK
jgi:tetratricopeptide (TPR) repeat protein